VEAIEKTFRENKRILCGRKQFLCAKFFSGLNKTIQYGGKKRKRKETDNKMPVFELGGL
jgi:hypothetical protein